MIKWIGAAFVVAACGWFGFSLAVAHKKEEDALRSLIGILDHIQCELQYRLTPLPELFLEAGRHHPDRVGNLFLKIAEHLEEQIQPDAESCLGVVLRDTANLPKRTEQALRMLGVSLGKFDVSGQVEGIETVRRYCRGELEGLAHNRAERLRSYQTLGICAGAALVILFI